MKKILGTYTNDSRHWVGDGFPVRTLFTYDTLGQQLSPFLMLDYAGPARFEQAAKPRGVGEHPHRGFETVTVVYQGEVEHRDSAGGGGKIGPGDVQWMTAASGVLHDEFHSHDFTRTGGLFEMVQLWVNLPARDKMAPPAYQTLLAADIPAVALPDGGGTVRVIAGDYAGHRGPARTFTPVDLWDMRLNPGATVELDIAEGRTLALVVLHGEVQVNGTQDAREAQMVVLDRGGQGAMLEAKTGATVLLLGGEPIDEPISGYGPFVMNTREQIVQAINDFNSGKFGRMPA
jgi:quercetin 2,3-dioxygenase